MARRVVIEEECPIHGGFDPHWSSGQQNSNGPYRTCQMSQRRVLDSGSFECVDNVDEKWLYLVTEEVHQALAGGEQP